MSVWCMGLGRAYSLVYFFVLAFCGAAWLPLAPGFELPNAVALLVVAFAFVSTGRKVIIPPTYIFLSAALIFIYFGLALHGSGGQSNVIRSAAYVAFGLALAQMPIPSLRPIVRASTWVFICIIYVSFLLAGKDLLSSTVDYLTSFNRGAFVFHGFRPALNAFASGDVQYVASIINIIASAFTISFVIAVTHKAYDAAAVAGLFVFVLFSSASVLTVSVVLLLLGIRWIIMSPRKLGPILAVALAVCLLPVIYDQAASYLALNISSDGTSRAARLSQYSASLEYINARPIWGHGYVDVNGYAIHNSLLFAWVSAGILPAMLILGVYIIAIYKATAAANRALTGDIRWACVFGLLVLFVVRISVGGGGGLPGATAITALAMALGIERALRLEARNALPETRTVFAHFLAAKTAARSG